jgi:hypothetical protein
VRHSDSQISGIRLKRHSYLALRDGHVRPDAGFLTVSASEIAVEAGFRQVEHHAVRGVDMTAVGAGSNDLCFSTTGPCLAHLPQMLDYSER